MRSVLFFYADFSLFFLWFITSREVKTQALVEKEMKNIDFNDVDQFSPFENCDENQKQKKLIKQCFVDTLLTPI